MKTLLIANRGEIARRIICTAHRMGIATVAVEGVPAVVTLPSEAARTTCFALDPSGARKKEVPVEKAAGGCKIAIGPQYQTVWYEIAVQ